MSKKNKKAVALDCNIVVLTNDMTPQKVALMEMFYRGAFANTLGYMDALNEETGEVEQLIVGFDKNAVNGQVDTYPLARLLAPSEVAKYKAPDGKGGYF
jgi:hypothetical protein